MMELVMDKNFWITWFTMIVKTEWTFLCVWFGVNWRPWIYYRHRFISLSFNFRALLHFGAVDQFFHGQIAFEIIILGFW
jgi:hypothetical protein